jgi:hypothetical protein
MGENKLDTVRATNAARAIVDGRHPDRFAAEIMVTLEHTVAAVLLLIDRDPHKAAAMLNEGLVQGVEARLADYNAKVKR